MHWTCTKGTQVTAEISTVLFPARLKSLPSAHSYSISCASPTYPHKYRILSSITALPLPSKFLPIYYSLDVRRSVHHSIIYIENPTIYNSVPKFYFIFIWSSTCFGRNTAHHQKPKTALEASGFTYVEGCCTCSCWTLSASSNYTYNTPRMQNQRLLL
jgi:hypothetical protein